MRDLDLVLFGATGFTGQLVAEHLAAHAPPTLQWALGGRSESKLAALRDRLAQAHAHLATLPLIVADSMEVDDMDRVAARARVVCTTVGPYSRYGMPLAGACARAGTHYCDLTGEVPFMRASIDAWDAVARGSGARIVHACGYDSIPSDLGVLALQASMTEDGAPAERVVTGIMELSGGLSGGTLASMLAILDDVSTDRDLRRALAKPYTLDPAASLGGPSGHDQTSPTYDPMLDSWTAPWFMGPVNTRVVRRSHALLGHPWGADFRYHETAVTGTGLRGRALAWGITLGLGAFLGASATPLLRHHLIERLLPKPGQGPSPATRAAGGFRHLVVGARADGSHGALTVSGPLDPGYGSTAILLGETALALAGDEPNLPDSAGVLTPATALGMPLVARLNAAGITFEA